MKPGAVAGLVMAAFVLLVCLANLVLALAEGGPVTEWIFWLAGILMGLVGIAAFTGSLRTQQRTQREQRAQRERREQRTQHERRGQREQRERRDQRSRRDAPRSAPRKRPSR